MPPDDRTENDCRVGVLHGAIVTAGVGLAAIALGFSLGSSVVVALLLGVVFLFAGVGR